MSSAGSETHRLDRGIAAAVAGLLELARPDGSWAGRLSPAATATGAAMIALRLADPSGSGDAVARAVTWLCGSQDSSGGWGEDVGSPATPNATAIAVAGLALAGGSSAAVRRGLGKIDQFGGEAALRDRSRCSLSAVCLRLMALAGLADEATLTRVPLGLALLPRFLRSKLSFTVPGVMSWGIMDGRLRPGHWPSRLVRWVAEPRALAYLDELVEFEGDGGGFEESPLMCSCVAIGLHRAGVRPDLVSRCLDYLRATQRSDGSWAVNRDLEVPITAYVAIGLHDAGAGDAPELAATAEWFTERQRGPMKGTIGCPPGGWGWAWSSGWPNTGDTTATMLALARLGFAPSSAPMADGSHWLLRMQNRDGSWSCFTRNGTRTLDGPCSVMSSDAVSALHLAGGLTADHEVIRRAVRWFASAQRPDGAITCRWYIGLTAGTAGVLRALTEIGLGDGVTARRCRKWLLASQNGDGGWGYDPGEPSAAELTAWAMLALVAAPSAGSPTQSDPPELGSAAAARSAALGRAADYLVSAQRDDGLWMPTVFGVYFLDVLYASDHHANAHALQALSRYREWVRATEADALRPGSPAAADVG
jgi:squalene-hopene/tetraprenyl-beta-curcumene cyclase